MSSEDTEGARRPVQTEPGVLVHSGADRRLATEHWLLSTLTDRKRQAARREWERNGITALPMGTLMSAVRLPASLVVAATGGRFLSGEVDRMLGEIFEGGPVICDPGGHRYYALVPASVPRTWPDALDDWRAHEVECLGKGYHLCVPRLDITRHDEAYVSYWSVPMPSMATLCTPLRVARLIAAGVHALGAQAGADR
ncbi:hypothetical protein [Streptomyces sp. NBC_00582]|uniref:hypothetical protein n=1 Tax=Streptomyces sp. NBC_00582 TaxID=2975783 RepID=UPI002E81BE7A|nr:hypothetical protein [Streptomyces sp. NBC_00582]WUB61554.1 hypothetical protein OG852_14700 [Streptomyces sp. NBC_00582]